MENEQVFLTVNKAIQEHRKVIQGFAGLPLSDLLHSPKPGGWGVLECIEHLNLTNKYYLSAINKTLENPMAATKDSYSQGVFGKMMIRSMQPKNGKRGMGMKTFKHLIPQDIKNEQKQVFEKYLSNLTSLEALLKQSEKLDLGKHRVVSLVGPILKFKLGDCFQFLVAHDARHLLQANKALASKSK